jgi:hypothetical protein
MILSKNNITIPSPMLQNARHHRWQNQSEAEVLASAAWLG